VCQNGIVVKHHIDEVLVNIADMLLNNVDVLVTIDNVLVNDADMLINDEDVLINIAEMLVTEANVKVHIGVRKLTIAIVRRSAELHHIPFRNSLPPPAAGENPGQSRNRWNYPCFDRLVWDVTVGCRTSSIDDRFRVSPNLPYRHR
jgi:hypothetical protein